MEGTQVVVKRMQTIADARKSYCCMTEVPTPWPDALCTCRDWVAKNLGKYVEGYHLETESGDVVGHLYYAPSERALVPYQIEPGVAVLYCDWVQQRYQGQGLSARLFSVFLEDMRQAGAKGILVEATDVESQMHYRHYLARGFAIIHDAGRRKLLFLPLGQAQISVSPLKQRIEPRRRLPVEILIVNGYLCPFEVSTQLILQSIALEFGDRVTVREACLTPETMEQYGVAKGFFINGRQKLFGGETEEAIRRAILEEF